MLLTYYRSCSLEQIVLLYIAQEYLLRVSPKRWPRPFWERGKLNEHEPFLEKRNRRKLQMKDISNQWNKLRKSMRKKRPRTKEEAARANDMVEEDGLSVVTVTTVMGEADPAPPSPSRACNDASREALAMPWKSPTNRLARRRMLLVWLLW